MKNRFHFVFVIFCLTAVLVLTVYLRSIENHVFYKLCSTTAEQSRLKQQLWREQLRLENTINPAAIWQRLDESAYKDLLNRH